MDVQTPAGLPKYEEYLAKARAEVSPRSPDDLTRVSEFINNYDFWFVEEKLKAHIKDFGSCFNQEDVDRVMPQFRAFLFLMYKFPDDPVSPNTEIDHCWHQFVLHSKEYEKFCMDVYGEMKYHTPFHWGKDGKLIGYD